MAKGPNKNGGNPLPLASPVLDAEVLQGATVLIVDDSPANVALLTRILTSAGAASVHGVTDSREALGSWREVSADIVLLDLHMPHMDGFAVMSAMHAAMPEGQYTPILILTADGTSSTRDQALRAGANDFVTKPFDRTEVVLRVGNLLRTAKLHESVRQHNAVLAAELERRARDEMLASAREQALRERIDAAMHNGEPRMVFQPIVDMVEGTTIGVEALARFSHDPAQPPSAWFLDAASVGMGVQLELAAIEGALTAIDQLPQESFLAINVSPATTESDQLRELLEHVPANRIVLELTEHTEVADYDTLLAVLAPLRARGIRIAVDDTGAGFAGLSHLLRVRPDIVKLDIALTRDIDSDPARRALAAGLVAFAREIGAHVIAEGIETAQELATLRSLGIGWGQGYHLARPGEFPSVLNLNNFERIPR